MRKLLQIILTTFFLFVMFLANGNVLSVESVRNENLASETASLTLPTDNFLNGTHAIQPAIMLNFVERLRDRRRLYNINNLCFSFIFTLGTLAIIFIVKFYSVFLKKIIRTEFVPHRTFITQYKVGTQVDNTVLLI